MGGAPVYSSDHIEDYQRVAARQVKDILGLANEVHSAPWVSEVVQPTTYREADITWRLARTATGSRAGEIGGTFPPFYSVGDYLFDLYRDGERGETSYLAWLAKLLGVR
jgi:hypothetical protein